MLTQQAANIINQLENELTDNDAHVTQEAIDIISELENCNTNNDDDNNALLESPSNAQQLTRDSLQCLIDDKGWIENEVTVELVNFGWW
jgi:archaellum component FlaG (FlaF/FlaG flagellin family)